MSLRIQLADKIDLWGSTSVCCSTQQIISEIIGITTENDNGQAFASANLDCHRFLFFRMNRVKMLFFGTYLTIHI